MTAEIPDGWIPWSGGPCPVALDSRPLIITRCGVVGGFRSFRASTMKWEHDAEPHDFDVVAYCPEPST